MLRTSFQFFFFALLLIVCDQLVKYLVIVFGGQFVLSHRGFIGGDLKLPLAILLTFVLFVLLYVAYYQFKSNINWPISLITAGAVSNLIDRIARGGVVDYIDLRVWPVFNLADVLIVGGVVWLVAAAFRKLN